MANEPTNQIQGVSSIQPEQPKNLETSVLESQTRSQLKAVGNSGTELFAGYFSEEYLRKLRGRSGAKIYDEMRRSEPQIAMILAAIMNPIKSGTWEIEAPSIPNGELHKDFIKFNAFECIDFETHLHEALTMLIQGYSLFEVVHNVVINHPKYGTFNGLKELEFRNQKTIERWNFENGKLANVEQWTQGDLTDPKQNFPKMLAEFLLIFTVQKEGDNYEGISVLRPMYGPWFRKNLYLKIAGIGMEKAAIGTPVGKIPSGQTTKEQVAEFKDTLANFTAHEASFITMPAGWELEIVKNEFDASAAKDMITLEDTQMVNAVVANFLALGMNGGGGSFALGSDLSDFFLTGIQTFANIICGVWNRKLIPDLIKMNYGPQEAYPKLKAKDINDKAGKELADIVKTLIDGKVVRPDDVLEASMRERFKLPKADVATIRKVEDPKPFFGGGGGQFSETRLQLAESFKKQWDTNKKSLQDVMQAGLKDLTENLKKQIKSKYNGATPAQRPGIILKVQPIGLPQYKADLREKLAEIAADGIKSAQKDAPWTKKIKLSEKLESYKLAAPRGGYFEALPSNIKKIVQVKANLIGESQFADLNKIVSFQYSSSATSTEDIDQILIDIDDATIGSKTMSAEAAAGNAVSSTTNEARLEWFFEPEVLNTIESFTFYNEDPVSQICIELDGMTWAVGDPDLDRYSPPLHHLCKSRLLPNEKGADGNPEIDRKGTPVSEKALNSITLSECECSYHLELADEGRWVTVNEGRVLIKGDKIQKADSSKGDGLPNTGTRVESSSGGAVQVNEHDKNAAFEQIMGPVKDKDYSKFEKEFERELSKAKLEKANKDNAKDFYRSHKEDMDNNSQKSFTKANARGKDLKDPSIAVKVNGKIYVIDGQHRLNTALAAGKEANVVVVDGSFLSKYGVSESHFEGKKYNGV